jgi:hypothetical protein
MKKIYVITHFISTVFVFLFLLGSIFSIFFFVKFTNVEGPTFDGAIYLLSPFFITSLFTLEFYVRRYPKKQSLLTKIYFFSALFFIFIIFIVMPNYIEKRDLSFTSGPPNHMFVFFISSLFYLFLSFFIVSKITNDSDEEIKQD